MIYENWVLSIALATNGTILWSLRSFLESTVNRRVKGIPRYSDTEKLWILTLFGVSTFVSTLVAMGFLGFFHGSPAGTIERHIWILVMFGPLGLPFSTVSFAFLYLEWSRWQGSRPGPWTYNSDAEGEVNEKGLDLQY
ncbi:hypothetical protein PG993_000786 [Apiospora rasikravindrae]|uniref:Uncharacterized protein n=1 Tax=Apiospora rasikravindrae TaxID=990691 RepID=A0ABR1U9J7_9PEZI